MISSLNGDLPLLVITKLSAPQRRPNLVSRPRLLSRLMEGTTRILTLVCAPAGYGKSTLLTEWIENLQVTRNTPTPTIRWLSLDEGDNDPIIFLRYLVAALENGNPQMCSVSRNVDTLALAISHNRLIAKLSPFSGSLIEF